MGESNNSHFYGIDNIEEASAYLKHPVLGVRLREITATFLNLKGVNAQDVFGFLDAMKVCSCMTLFDEVSEDDLYRKVIDRHYDELADEKTLVLLGKSKAKFLCGAIAGDIIGSIYEFRPFKNTDFSLFSDSSEFTDDTVMTIANADWLLSGDSLLGIMQDWATVIQLLAMEVCFRMVTNL